MSIIEVNHLCFGYDGNEVLRDLSFSVAENSFVAIAGPNGAGKSTLLRLLCGLRKPCSGAIEVDGKAISSYNSQTLSKEIAVVRQEFVPVFGFSVTATVMMARTAYFGHGGFESEDDRAIVEDAMKATDTFQFGSRLLGELSGGERQRVFIARSLAQDTRILLLDEPTSFLDLKHQVEIYDLLKKMQLEQNKTIVTITHDINLAIQYSEETLLLGTDGSYHIGSSAQVLQPHRINEIFGVNTIIAQADKHNFLLPLGKLSKYNRSVFQKPS